MPAFAATTNIVQYNGGTIRSLNGEVFTFNCVMRNNVMSSLDRSHKQHIPARTVLLTVQLSLFSALPEMAALINSITLLLAAAQRHWLQRNSIQTLPHRATLKPSNQRKKKNSIITNEALSYLIIVFLILAFCTQITHNLSPLKQSI